MGREERTSRKTIVEKATAALDKTVECIAAVNNQARTFEAHERRFAQHEIENNRRFTAQASMVDRLDTKLTDADVEILRIVEAFQQMTVFQRLAWVLFGYVPKVETGRADGGEPAARAPLAGPSARPVTPAAMNEGLPPQ